MFMQNRNFGKARFQELSACVALSIIHSRVFGAVSGQIVITSWLRSIFRKSFFGPADCVRCVQTKIPVYEIEQIFTIEDGKLTRGKSGAARVLRQGLHG